jgi:SAM-dependent methyltransferase
MDPEFALESNRKYFAKKLQDFGPTPQGVDWNSQQSQQIRFVQLARVIDGSQPYSLVDYGCGFGAFLDYLLSLNHFVTYFGVDVVEGMVAEAKARHTDYASSRFTTQETDLQKCDYAVESGIFNIKFGASNADWEAYVLQTLGKLNDLSQKGFSFNLLTSYSDPEFMRKDLYYANPCFYFDYCKKHFSKNVALFHDYDLYDFTIVVRK